MTTLYDHICSRNSGGLAYEDAVQLFLWIYCTLDVLPPALRTLPIGRDVLVATFERLTEDGVIVGFPVKALNPTKIVEPHWRVLVDDLLSKRIALDQNFRARIGQFV